MNRAGLIFPLSCMVWLTLAAGLAAAQNPPPTYQPRTGQQGKDVVWIPSPDALVARMLDMARVTPKDYVIDLGSGDGRNVIAAAKRGARALGVEYNPDLVELSKRAAATAGVADKASFVQGDMFAADISPATVLVLFLIPDNLTRLVPKFLALKPGTRIVSNTYEIDGNWEVDQTEVLSGCASWCAAHLYIVPARVAGTWRMAQGELVLEQDFQHLAGTYEINGFSLPVENAQLRGNTIRFTVNAVEYTGSVNGNEMQGMAKGRNSSAWSAVRNQ